MLRAMNLGFPLFLGLLLAALCASQAGAQTVTNVRAAQRAGTKLVDVYYELSGGSGPFTVAVAVSDNGGASYDVPATALSGDVGGEVNAGANKHVVWNAGADWNGQLSQAVRFRISASASESFAFMPTKDFTVDTRAGGNLSITGRVLNGRSRARLGNAVVMLAGSMATSGEDGQFSLVNAAGGGAGKPVGVQVSAAGFLSQAVTVWSGNDERSVDVGDILLTPSMNNFAAEMFGLTALDGMSCGCNEPRVTLEFIKPNVDGIYLEGFGLTPNLETKVGWNGFTPEKVELRINGVSSEVRTGSGAEYNWDVPVDSALRTTYSEAGNLVSVVATPQDPGSDPASVELSMRLVPVPEGLRAVVNQNQYQIFGPDHVGFDFELPRHEQKVTLPLVGTFGFEWGANASFDYTVKDTVWELAVGLGAEGKHGKRGRRPAFPGMTRSPKAKLYVGNKEIHVNMKGFASGLATPTAGIVLQSMSVSAELSARLELTRYGLLDLFGPGLTNAFSKVPGVDGFLKNVSIIVWLIPSLEGDATTRVSPFSFDAAELVGRIGVEGAYEPKIMGVLSGRVYIGTDGEASFKLPDPVFRNVTFRLYGGYEISAWALRMSKEVVFVSYTYPSDMLMPQAPSAMDVGTGFRLESAANRDVAWRAMGRPWRQIGEEKFLQGAGYGLRSSGDGVASSEIDIFARMGNSDSTSDNGRGEGRGIRQMMADTVLPVQAELPLLENVLPDSEPALASQGQNLMLLYVRDTGAPNPLHFTEVAWTFFDGASWTMPAPVAGDVRGQFEPVVSFDGHGAAVAVWTRMRNAEFASEDLDAMAAQMEVVSAWWNPVAKTWSAPEALSDNTFLDHKPRLAGPLENGDLILAWRENAGNQLIGSEEQSTRIMMKRWNAAAGAWGDVQELVPGLAGEFSVSLAAKAGKAALVITRAMTNAEDLSDTELFFKIWDEETGFWSGLTRHTVDAVSDRNAQVAFGPNGDIYCVWQRGGDLVMDVNFSGNPTMVRPDSGTLGFSDLAVTVGPEGNVVVLWQEMSQYGSDAQYRVYDPASGTWGKDAFLSQDADLERSFAPVWDAEGNLTLAYNNVEIVKETKSVVVEGGQVIEVKDVPQPGRVDLLLAKRRLVKDVMVVPEGLKADGANFLPGDEVTLRVKVRNAGNLAAQDLQVAFYDGDPDAGGMLIATEVIPGWLGAQEEAEVSHEWMVPQPAQARTIHVVVDPDNEVTEAHESNNRLALPINGVDLALEYQSGSVLLDGSARVVVKVRNLSAPDAPVSTLRLKDYETGDVLTEVLVSQLAPGQSVDVPLDLPVGTQPEGSRAYVLVIDEEELVEDMDRENNAAPFSLNLWIDDDRDGIPRWWELVNDMTDNNAGDALLDLDGDGFNAMQEYLAGTDPEDYNSRFNLRVQNVMADVNGEPGMKSISWPSVAGRLYRLERSYDLKNWETVEQNIEASPPMNHELDTTGMAGERVFYRVMVQ